MSCGLWSSPSRAAAGGVLFPGNPRGILLLGLRVALLPLLRLDLAIDLQFLVSVGGASRLAICRLQLVVNVIDIRFKPRRSLQMLNGLILVARVQQLFPQLILRLGMIGMRRDQGLQDGHSLVFL